MAVLGASQTKASLVGKYADEKPITFTEMTAALVNLIWTFRSRLQLTAATLTTNSSVVFGLEKADPYCFISP
jgi:hypothetical protein